MKPLRIHTRDSVNQAGIKQGTQRGAKDNPRCARFAPGECPQAGRFPHRLWIAGTGVTTHSETAARTESSCWQIPHSAIMHATHAPTYIINLDSNLIGKEV